ncbi:MAG: hypothetical protein ACREJM_03725, partial [Candidatus Saccharimonadales bacterium]
MYLTARRFLSAGASVFAALWGRLELRAARRGSIDFSAFEQGGNRHDLQTRSVFMGESIAR